jgi:hypothetical protein
MRAVGAIFSARPRSGRGQAVVTQPIQTPAIFSLLPPDDGCRFCATKCFEIHCVLHCVLPAKQSAQLRRLSLSWNHEWKMADNFAEVFKNMSDTAGQSQAGPLVPYGYIQSPKTNGLT